MNKSFGEWFNEGESIYADSMAEYQALVAQIEEMETRLGEKKAEVNHIAQMLGKPPVEENKRLSAELIENESRPARTIGSVTRALTGRSFVTR